MRANGTLISSAPGKAGGDKGVVVRTLVGHFYSFFSQYITANVDAVDGSPGSVSSSTGLD